MNDAQLRRKELLESARALYSDRDTPPLIHPRYGVASPEIEKPDGDAGTFGLRALVCGLILTAFVVADHKGIEIRGIDSQQVMQMIRQSTAEEMWKDL